MTVAFFAACLPAPAIRVASMFGPSLHLFAEPRHPVFSVRGS